MHIGIEIEDLICTIIAGFQVTIKAVREFGNIENLRQEIIEIENCRGNKKYLIYYLLFFSVKLKCAVDFFLDLRVKGFSKDGIFRSDSYRSYYTLFNLADINDGYTLANKNFGSLVAYILATKTAFCGKKFDKKWRDLYNDENVVFMSQLFAKSFGVYCNPVSDVRSHFNL